MSNLTEGWTWLINSRKWHYFVEKRSLCKKWTILGNPELEPSNKDDDKNSINCKPCIKKLSKRNEKVREVKSNHIE
jgi:hypothetical protein